MSGAGPVGSEPIGGQALVEGVMMRRGDRWGAAVRQPDGRIVTISRELPPGLDRILSNLVSEAYGYGN